QPRDDLRPGRVQLARHAARHADHHPHRAGVRRLPGIPHPALPPAARPVDGEPMTTDASPLAMLADPAVIACPYPAYAGLRAHCPVFEVPGMGLHLITRYDDIARVLRDPATFSS